MHFMSVERIKHVYVCKKNGRHEAPRNLSQDGLRKWYTNNDNSGL